MMGKPGHIEFSGGMPFGEAGMGLNSVNLISSCLQSLIVLSMKNFGSPASLISGDSTSVLLPANVPYDQ